MHFKNCLTVFLIRLCPLIFKGTSFIFESDKVAIKQIVITDTPSASLISPFAGYYGAATNFDSTGTLTIYLNPDLNTTVGPNKVLDTILGNIVHEFSHYVPEAMAYRDPDIRHKYTLEAENQIRESLGLPIKSLEDLKTIVNGPTPFFFKMRNDQCFLAGTPITMWDGSEKPIEDIRPGDVVLSFDKDDPTIRVPGKVSRAFRGVTRHVVNLRGLHCTPGHRFRTGDGGFSTIASILKSDGTIVEKDGTVIRARTGARIGSVEDALVNVAIPDPRTGALRAVLVRAGIPCLHLRDPESGEVKSTLPYSYLLEQSGVTIEGPTRLRMPDGSYVAALDWPQDSSPLDGEHRRNWIVRDLDGAPFTPEWIAKLPNETAEEGLLEIVGEMSGPSFHASGSGRPPSNRRDRRRQAALARVK